MDFDNKNRLVGCFDQKYILYPYHHISTVVNILKKGIKLLGLSPSHVTAQSFRIGAATAASLIVIIVISFVSGISLIGYEKIS